MLILFVYYNVIAMDRRSRKVDIVYVGASLDENGEITIEWFDDISPKLSVRHKYHVKFIYYVLCILKTRTTNFKTG